MAKSTDIDRSNNFDFLRLLFATLVIVSHSYPLTGKPEAVAAFTDEQLSLGSLSVDCFFIMSGYLIMTSLQRSKSIQDYMWKRVLRLYPAYIVLLVLTMLFMPIVYHGNNIFAEKTYWSYFSYALSLYNIHYKVNGIFETNPYPFAINGSLWSLSYEFTMYIALLFLFPLRNYRNLKIIALCIFTVSLFCTVSDKYILENTLKKCFLQPNEFYRLCTFFMAGSALVFFDLKRLNSLWLKSSLFFLLLSSLYLGVYKYVSPIALPFLIILTGITRSPFLSDIGKKFGDISYGVYIYAFIVQQTLMYYFGLSTWELTIFSIGITYILAYGSWHLIEKKMLTFKNLLK